MICFTSLPQRLCASVLSADAGFSDAAVEEHSDWLHLRPADVALSLFAQECTKYSLYAPEIGAQASLP